MTVTTNMTPAEVEEFKKFARAELERFLDGYAGTESPDQTLASLKGIAQRVAGQRTVNYMKKVG